jgi:hypothetical protein
MYHLAGIGNVAVTSYINQSFIVTRGYRIRCLEFILRFSGSPVNLNTMGSVSIFEARGEALP